MRAIRPKTRSSSREHVVTIDTDSAPRIMFSGENLHVEDLPVGTRVIYPKRPMTAVARSELASALKVPPAPSSRRIGPFSTTSTAQPPVLAVSAVKTARRNLRLSALMCESRGRAEYGKPMFIEKELSRTKLVATYLTSLARLAPNSTHENSTHGWVNCARRRSFGAMRHHRAIVLAPA